MDVLDDMEESKLSAKVFLKVNYSFKLSKVCKCQVHYRKVCLSMIG